MIEKKNIKDLNDFFYTLNERPEKGVYFYRLNCWNKEIGGFIEKYYDAAVKTGVVIEGKIPNPDLNNLSYYNEIMGESFSLDENFFRERLKKWLPRMNNIQNSEIASSMYNTLMRLKLSGKNDNMLKNAYIKFMCWLYYKFERVVSRMGENEIPKILYEGYVSNYELLLLSMLAGAGCDVLLLQYSGDEKYLKTDVDSQYSYNYATSEKTEKFPENYCLKTIRENIRAKNEEKILFGANGAALACTNKWAEKIGIETILKPCAARGNDNDKFYNCFIEINGVEDKLTYINELHNFYNNLQESKRNVVVIENGIVPPDNEEISKINRKNYDTIQNALKDLALNIKLSSKPEIEKTAKVVFKIILNEEFKKNDMNVNKIVSSGVYLLCWFNTYKSQLFSGLNEKNTACIICMNGCRNKNEALFLKFMSGLPVDVLVLNPDLNRKCVLDDDNLFVIDHKGSLAVDKFPKNNNGLRIGTAAYHAERELDEILYSDTGLYRDMQYKKAETIYLRTMYEEIAILWNEDLKYRPQFGTANNIVNMPVIFAKISGVKDNDVRKYWIEIKKLITEDTFYIGSGSIVKDSMDNPIKPFAVGFYKNGRLLKSAVKNHKAYKYGFLREDIQDLILDKLEKLINEKTIKGTFQNGTEYTIISTILDMNMEILRSIQNFDFTKKNPKLIYINTTERSMSLEDSILTAFLSLVGFDVLFFVPTGYCTVENYFNNHIMEEHQIGTFVYDLVVPDMHSVVVTETLSQKWQKFINKKGR